LIIMPTDHLRKPWSLPALLRSASIAGFATILFTAPGLTISSDARAQTPSAAGEPAASTQPAAPAESAPSPLAGPYRTWIDEDVRWIIASNERSAYTALQTNPERLQFIRDFWERRNPNPGSSENAFKEEHYRRLAYANERFASGRPGWTSDRGRIYILHGKPDSIDAHPSGEAVPFEVWHYSVIKPTQPDSIRENVDFKFVDTCRCGDYKLTSPTP
jgi:GWxTD domain-containing protein